MVWPTLALMVHQRLHHRLVQPRHALHRVFGPPAEECPVREQAWLNSVQGSWSVIACNVSTGPLQTRTLLAPGHESDSLAASTTPLAALCPQPACTQDWAAQGMSLAHGSQLFH